MFDSVQSLLWQDKESSDKTSETKNITIEVYNTL